jgi:hypothetical protein
VTTVDRSTLVVNVMPGQIGVKFYTLGLMPSDDEPFESLKRWLSEGIAHAVKFRDI